MSETVQRPDLAPWTANDATFGARLALVRQRRGWGNVKEAALICGVPAQSWRSWERDGVMPQGGRYFGVCAQIAAASGCDYGWLVDRRPSGSSEPTVASPAPELRMILGGGDISTPRSPLLQPV
jgi:hypothetical protein